MTRGFSAKKLLSITSIILFFLLVIGYGIWRSGDLLFGITLSVKNIQNGQVVTDPVLTLTGKSRHSVGMVINNRSVPVEQDGSWDSVLALLPGVNVITIQATDKFGKIISKVYEVYLDAPVAVAKPIPVKEPEPTLPPEETATTTEEEIEEPTTTPLEEFIETSTSTSETAQ